MGESARPEWRLLLTGFDGPYMNMGIDESILIHRSRGQNAPTIRLYGWSKPTVSIGYFQRLGEEVDLDKAMQLGVGYVRRISGGGSVLHEREVTYSLVASETDPTIPSDVQESIRLICGGVVSGLRELGIDAEFKPVNDVVVGDRKVSGSAQTRKFHSILQHGTVLLEVDHAKALMILKRASKAKKQVAGINECPPGGASFQRVSEVLARGFERELRIKLVKGTLSEGEGDLAAELAAGKYSTVGWNQRL
ncbi:lipoate--protein ligase family protein [bacterium]|nr:MAG: lipoate--protein ligase family protein [bacterium]